MGKKDMYIALFDRWNKKDLENSRYVWLPFSFEGDKITIPWRDKWNFDSFADQGVLKRQRNFPAEWQTICG